MNKVEKALSGISGIVLTPFDESGAINTASLHRLVARMAEAGVDNIVTGGNTGEFYALEEAEVIQHMRETRRAAGGDAIVTAGVGRALPYALRLARAAEAEGVDALMIHQPMEPFASPGGTVEYVRHIAQSTALPLVLYLRNDYFSAADIDALLGVPSVAGVKYAFPDVIRLSERIRATRDTGKLWICGLAEIYAAPFYAVGARGFTSGLVNVDPARSVAVRDALNAGDFAGAQALIDTVIPFEEMRARNFNGDNVTVVKEAVNLLGIPVGAVRSPGTHVLNEEQRSRLRAVLASWQAPLRKAS